MSAENPSKAEAVALTSVSSVTSVTSVTSTPPVRDVLHALLRGHATAGDALANTLRVEAFGHTTYGRTDALDLFATHPLVLSARPHVLGSAQALAVLDETADGRCIGVFADLANGVITRLWVVGATAAEAQAEAAVPVARDDFLSQLRVPCVGDAVDHPGLQARAWPSVLSLGVAALAASPASTQASILATTQASTQVSNQAVTQLVAQIEADQPAASSSQAVVLRSFSSGAEQTELAALYSLRVQEHSAPRRAQRRLAMATARLDGSGALVHQRLAVSDPLPEPAPVFFLLP